MSENKRDGLPMTTTELKSSKQEGERVLSPLEARLGEVNLLEITKGCLNHIGYPEENLARVTRVEDQDTVMGKAVKLRDAKTAKDIKVIVDELVVAIDNALEFE